MTNIISDNGLNLIILSEGSKLTAYPDSCKPPVWTIGTGCITMPNGEPVKEGDIITQQEELEMLKLNIKQRSDKLNLLCPRLNQNQFDAIMSFAYQEGSWQGSTLIRLAGINPDDTQIKNEFKKWIYVSGIQSDGVVIRRGREIVMYTGMDKAALIKEWQLLADALKRTNQQL